jgi:RNA polymerase sigma-70 factor (ECF subfamily)
VKLFGVTYSKLSDEELMAYLSMGDKRAFDTLYERYANALKYYFKRMLWKDEEKAEDFVHDLFAKIIQKPESFDQSRNFKTWFYSVANNMCKNEYKKQEVRKNTVSGIDESYSFKDANTNVLNEVQDKLFASSFEKSMTELDEKHREVFELRHLDGLSIKEIAEVIQISEGTVKSRLFYATKYLAEGLKEFNPVLNR